MEEDAMNTASMLLHGFAFGLYLLVTSLNLVAYGLYILDSEN